MLLVLKMCAILSKNWAAHGTCLGISNSHGGKHLPNPASSSISMPFGQCLLAAPTSVSVLRTVRCKAPFLTLLRKGVHVWVKTGETA